MDASTHDKHAGAGHDWLHVVIGCGLTILLLVLLPAVDSAWGTVLILVALALCPVVMFLVMLRMQAPTTPAGSGRRSCHEDHA